MGRKTQITKEQMLKAGLGIVLRDGGSITTDHKNTGYSYIDMAIDEPNLIRYLRSNEAKLRAAGGIGFIFDKEKAFSARKGWAAEMHISEEQAAEFMQFMITHTEGVVSLILSGVIRPTKAEAHQMLDDAGTAYAYGAFLKSTIG